MSLESLVPPLVLCQQLKPGDFPESALVWRICKDGSYCPVERHFLSKNWKNPEELFFFPAPPAPTLEEILNSIEKIDGITFAKGGIYYAKKQVLIESFYYPTNATAALRLWMRVNGREVKI